MGEASDSLVGRGAVSVLGWGVGSMGEAYDNVVGGVR